MVIISYKAWSNVVWLLYHIRHDLTWYVIISYKAWSNVVWLLYHIRHGMAIISYEVLFHSIDHTVETE